MVHGPGGVAAAQDATAVLFGEGEGEWGPAAIATLMSVSGTLA